MRTKEKVTVTQDDVKSILDYDKETGWFTWKKCPTKSKRWNKQYPGKRAGSLDSRGTYRWRVLYIKGKLRLESHMAILWMTGTLPEGMVVHHNGDGSDNRWCNLDPNPLLGHVGNDVRPKYAITQSDVQKLLDYDPDTGALMWRECSERGYSWNSKYAGKPAGGRSGTRKSPQRNVWLYGHSYLVHRVAFLLMTGEWPPQLVDHINGDPLDNRWCNLRLATPSQNVWNSRRLKGTKRPYKGVMEAPKGVWRAQITRNYQVYVSDPFDTPEKARDWYVMKAKELHGEFANPG